MGRWRHTFHAPLEMMKRSRFLQRHSALNCSGGLRFAAAAVDRPTVPLLNLKAYAPCCHAAVRYDDEWLYGEVPLDVRWRACTIMAVKWLI